jgi:hypothetical protein
MAELMPTNELLDFIKAKTAKMLATAEAKNHDYTGGHVDPFWNFSVGELLGIGSTEQGLLFRMSDKFMRVVGFVKRGVLLVADESVEDTLVDLANYSLILAAFIKHKREKAAK